MKRLGLGPEHAHRLETAGDRGRHLREDPQDPGAQGLEAFNQAALYGAYSGGERPPLNVG